MIANGQRLLALSPIEDMATTKQTAHGVSHGLSEAGYDIRIKQDVRFLPSVQGMSSIVRDEDGPAFRKGRFVLASSMERFIMPDCLVGVVHNKSSWARRGLSVFNTVIEPGWCGWLTLELVYHGEDDLIIPAGSGIAQVLFTRTMEVSRYGGKYNHQPDRPVDAIMEKG